MIASMLARVFFVDVTIVASSFIRPGSLPSPTGAAAAETPAAETAEASASAATAEATEPAAAEAATEAASVARASPVPASHGRPEPEL
jgi:hypothetical protein